MGFSQEELWGLPVKVKDEAVLAEGLRGFPCEPVIPHVADWPK